MSLIISDDDHVRGPENAAVTILVYGDYECPYTRAFEQSIAQLRRHDGDAFRYVFWFFPLREIHPYAEMAAEAAEAVSALAGREAFWKMHDALFANQNDLEQPNLEQQANTTGVDQGAFHDALETHRFAARVERDVRSGIANGVNGTPSVFINGERYRGGRDVATLREVLQQTK
jgi:protein-disulfide isomerase